MLRLKHNYVVIWYKCYFQFLTFSLIIIDEQNIVCVLSNNLFSVHV